MNLYFQQVRGYSALVTGLAILPQAIFVSLASFASGRVTRPARAARADDDRPPRRSRRMAFTMPAATTAIIESAPAERGGVASGVLNASRQVGGVIGVAVLGTLISHRATFLPGLHAGLAIAAGSFLAACAVTRLTIERRSALMFRIPGRAAP